MMLFVVLQQLSLKESSIYASDRFPAQLNLKNKLKSTESMPMPFTIKSNNSQIDLNKHIYPFFNLSYIKNQ